MSYPVYILDLGEGEPTIVFPKDKEDVDHADFWERKVAGIVARYFRLNPKDLENLPYSQRRARIAGNNVLYGERTSKKLLKLIEKAMGETGLQFAYDEHESRLSYDVEEFNALLSQA